MSERSSAAATQRLFRLLDAIGPSGHEMQAANVWREMARETGAEVCADSVGNSYATVPGTSPDGPVVMVAAHIDEIGFFVRAIEDDGYLRFGLTGGYDPAVLVGQRVAILGRSGRVSGLMVRCGTHLMTDEEQDDRIVTEDLWFDIGAPNADIARKLVRVGDPGVIDAAPVLLPGGRVASRALDNRAGAFIGLEVLRGYARRPGKATLVVVANTQEEAGSMGGALVAANRVRPDVAFVLDLTVTTDHPEVDRKRAGGNQLGCGAIICRGGALSPVLFDLLERTAESRKLPYSLEGVGGSTGTDADAIAFTGTGVATGLLSVPSRYMHTPNEMVQLSDVKAVTDLLGHTIRAIRPGTDWSR
jgi:putative aminopeptidase FrvX